MAVTERGMDGQATGRFAVDAPMCRSVRLRSAKNLAKIEGTRKVSVTEGLVSEGRNMSRA